MDTKPSKEQLSSSTESEDQYSDIETEQSSTSDSSSSSSEESTDSGADNLSSTSETDSDSSDSSNSFGANTGGPLLIDKTCPTVKRSVKREPAKKKKLPRLLLD